MGLNTKNETSKSKQGLGLELGSILTTAELSSGYNSLVEDKSIIFVENLNDTKGGILVLTSEDPTIDDRIYSIAYIFDYSKRFSLKDNIILNKIHRDKGTKENLAHAIDDKVIVIHDSQTGDIIKFTYDMLDKIDYLDIIKNVKTFINLADYITSNNDEYKKETKMSNEFQVNANPADIFIGRTFLPNESRFNTKPFNNQRYMFAINVADETLIIYSKTPDSSFNTHIPHGHCVINAIIPLTTGGDLDELVIGFKLFKAGLLSPNNPVFNEDQFDRFLTAPTIGDFDYSSELNMEEFIYMLEMIVAKDMYKAKIQHGQQYQPHRQQNSYNRFQPYQSQRGFRPQGQYDVYDISNYVNGVADMVNISREMAGFTRQPIFDHPDYPQVNQINQHGYTKNMSDRYSTQKEDGKSRNEKLNWCIAALDDPSKLPQIRQALSELMD